MISRQPIRWKFGALAGLAVVVVTFIPQISLLVARGTHWQGAYVFTDPDELAYSAYLNSIMRGQPRRNNPELMRGDRQSAIGGETIFSIQLFPPYGLALWAHLFGLSASAAFILLTPIVAFTSSLALFWLLADVTGDDKRGAIGVLMILLCGILASTNPIAAQNNYAVFSFLRRYIPAVPFPLLFIFCLFVWRAFTVRGRNTLCWAAAAGATFSLLVYSYFFLWTAAGAWIFCLVLLWLVARPHDRTHVLKCVAVFGIIMVAALLPYFRMLSLRAAATDIDQALVLTHAPNLFRFTEILGALIICALAFGAYKAVVKWNSPPVLLAAACAITPFIAFNQQIVTGRSLQPFHYEQFVLNYLILVSAVITDQLLWKFVVKRPLLWVALALVVGVTLALKTSNVYSEQNVTRDKAIPIFERLQEDASHNRSGGAALFSETLLAASAPTNCSVPVLWSPFTYTYGTVNNTEDNERLFQYFYYTGVDERRFESMLKDEFVFRAALFGLPRVNRTLIQEFQPISAEEIRAQVKAYSEYMRGFSHECAALWPLSYVVLSEARAYDLSNLDRWYERDGGERIGDSVLYRVILKTEKKH